MKNNKGILCSVSLDSAISIFLLRFGTGSFRFISEWAFFIWVFNRFSSVLIYRAKIEKVRQFKNNAEILQCRQLTTGTTKNNKAAFRK